MSASGAKRISGTSDEIWASSQQLLKLAEKAGAQEAEVFGFVGRSTDVDLRKDEVELASERLHRGLGLRAVVKGAVGFSSTNDFSQLQFVAESAVRSARARGGDEAWRSLPGPKPVTRPEGIIDPALKKMGPEDCLEMAERMLSGCREISGADPTSGGVSCSFGIEFILNSHGIERQEEGSAMHASLEAVARGPGDENATGNEFCTSRSLRPGLESVGRTAAEMARTSLGGIKAETGTVNVLLKPIAFVDLMEYTFIPAISSDNVQKGRSHLASRVGQAVASECLSIVDDGLLPGGMGTSAFDGEGVPSQRTPVVEGGILKGFLYDSYTAGKAGISSTGSAVRVGYTDVPRVGIRNLVISSREPIDLLAEAKGILVNGVIGAHTANPISGDFSVEARNAFYVAPGEVPKPIRSAMLAGNMFELLKDMMVGTDVRAIGPVVTPTIGLKMKVVGS